jgi:hypothetical protein
MISMKNIIKKWVGVAGFYGLALASIAAADAPTLVNPLGTTDATVVLQNITTFLIAIAAPICGIMVVWGGFQMITARGNPEKFSEGKKTLLYAAVGFVVVLCAGGAAQVIQSIFNGS